MTDSDDEGHRRFAYQGHSSTSPTHFDPVPVAQDIAIDRGVCISEAFYHMAAIRTLVEDVGAVHVKCSGARVQDKGADNDKQAAHLVPGQILINARPIWELADAAIRKPEGVEALRELGVEPGLIERVSLRTQMCFAKTNVLPAIFNRADSQAERMGAEVGGGLKHLFGEAVKAMWTSARVDPERPLAIDRSAVLRGLGTWFSSVNGVYSFAAARKHAAASRASDSATKQRRSNEAQVLSVYANSFKVAADPSNFVRSRVSWVDQLYRKI